MDYAWAENYPDIRQMCLFFSMTEVYNPVRFQYKPLVSLIQQGPTCGLVALAMCADNPSVSLVQHIFADALSLGYTNNGEMFSALHMSELAKTVLSNNISLYSGLLNTNTVIDFLMLGGVILVPYDADADHSPCNKRGHKAHWGVVSGIIETDMDVFVILRQGKSLRPFIWRLSQLSESNSQLEEVSPERHQSDLEYIVPEGGLGGPSGLKNKAVFIHPITN